VITAILYNATFDNLDMNLTVRDGIISLGKLNSKQVRHSLTMSLFKVQNNFLWAYVLAWLKTFTL